MDDGDSDAEAASLLRISSRRSPHPPSTSLHKKARRRRGPKLVAWGGSRHTPFSRQRSHGELMTLGGERGGSRCSSKHLPDMLHGLDGQGNPLFLPDPANEIAKNLPLAPVKLHCTMPAEDAIKIKEGESGRQPCRDTFESFLYVPMRTVMVSTHTLLLAFYAVPQPPIDDRKLAVEKYVG
ncbi:hypothetical protein ZWY2020_020142 [Hordeum vulgare]|nr:hypothetical protein ZWY2020_020142 [Hordeum vulgare]